MFCSSSYCFRAFLKLLPQRIRSKDPLHFMHAVAFCVVLLSIRAEVSLAQTEQLPDGMTIESLRVSPDTVVFSSPFASTQILVTGILSDGRTLDATRMVSLDPSSSIAIVKINSELRIEPKTAGDGMLIFRLGSAETRVTVNVAFPSTETPSDFIRDVQPVLAKMGCNQGTCHGSAQGKNGFKLSLRGYDAAYDHRALADDLGSRRINRADPQQSLMLLKPTGAVPHVGGMLTKPGEPYYEILRTWIDRGARLEADAVRVSSISITPQNPTILLPGMSQQFVVIAQYSDGLTRDVTREAFIESGNIETASADPKGVVKALRRGESAVLVRYEGAYAATTLTIMGDRTGFEWAGTPPVFNEIDRLVDAKLQRVKTLPGVLCSDAEFLRRIHLDLVGLPPTPVEVRTFLADSRDTQIKRNEVIDRLIGSVGFVEHWTNKWADLLQVNSKYLGEEGAWAMREWIRQAVATNMPYNRFAYEVLTASGSTLENPPASYHKILRQPDLAMENTTQLFLAVRFSCNKCHDHPFERWTQQQHWSLAGYFAQIGRKEHPDAMGQKIGGDAVEGATPLVESIFDTTSGVVKHPDTGLVVSPTFPYQHDDHAPTTDPLRRQFAHWATSSSNQYFARSYANRLWSYLNGVGIIEPIDDIRAGNPATNPELLDFLSSQFIASGFDVRHALRLICSSRTYQLSVATNQWNEDDLVNYSHAIPRRLPAEVLFDTVYDVTGATRSLPGMPSGSRAAQQRDTKIATPDGFLDLFGRPPRESSCECERVGGVMLGQALSLVNGPTVADAIAQPSNEIARIVSVQPDDALLIDDLFVRVLSRPATSGEKTAASGVFGGWEADREKISAAFEKTQARIPELLLELQNRPRGPTQWTAIIPTAFTSKAGAESTISPEGIVSVHGKLEKDTYSLQAASAVGLVTGIRLDVLADPSLPAGGPGRAMNGNFVINTFALNLISTNSAVPPKNLSLTHAKSDFDQQGWAIAGAIDDNITTGWAVMGGVGKNHTATFELVEKEGIPQNSPFAIVIDQQFSDGTHALGRFQLFVTTDVRPLERTPLPEAVAGALAVPAGDRTADQIKTLADFIRSNDPEILAATKALADHEATRSRARLQDAQDLVWALVNSPAFLFNH